MKHHGIEEDLKYKAIRTEDDSKSSHLYGTYMVPDISLDALLEMGTSISILQMKKWSHKTFK